jgi:hypothetical protein
MSRRRLLASALATPALMPGLAQAQAFPNRPITMQISFPAGGATDVQMRSFAEAATRAMGQQVCKTACKSFQIPWVNSVQKFPPGVMRSSGLWAGESGVLVMDTIAKVRFRRSVGKESISSIARELNLSRPTVRKHCRTQTEPIYRRAQQPTPMLGAFQDRLESWLQTEKLLPKAQRRTARRLFEGLQAEGYRGAYPAIRE